MGVRDSLNKNRNLGIGAAAAVLLVGLGIIGIQFLRGGEAGVALSRQAFYSDDNGKSFFKDKILKVVPFDHNGKQAYLADVYKCPDGKQFVGRLYRHNAAGKKAMEQHIAKGDSDTSFLGGLAMQGMEVKLSGAPDTAWKPNTDPDVRTMKCPSGGTAELVAPAP
jgi:hypothetical protein